MYMEVKSKPYEELNCMESEEKHELIVQNSVISVSDASKTIRKFENTPGEKFNYVIFLVIFYFFRYITIYFILCFILFQMT